jgi:hypothetical protein
MNKFVIFFVCLLLLLTGFSRNMEADVDGEIEYVSLVESPAGAAVIDIVGNGRAAFTVETKADELTLSHNIKGAIDGPALITGIRLYNYDLHVTRLAKAGKFEHNYTAEIDTFPVVTIKTDDSFNGVFQRVIELTGDEMKLSEYLNFTGSGWWLDHIVFSQDDEESEQVK